LFAAGFARDEPPALPSRQTCPTRENAPMTCVTEFLGFTNARRVVCCATILFVGVATTSSSFAAKPTPPLTKSLHAEIDRLLKADWLVPPTPPADDAEFVRRATLDLHGIIPTAAETRAFLDDRSPDKRTQLIDRLLASPRFARHMATTFDVLLIERKQEKNISFDEWYEYLYQSFLTNKPYDQLVREVLAADESLRPATRFFHARTCEPDVMTRDIGRLFFGMDMQCNQCHDHPDVDDYKIGDYYGLRAFVSRTYVFNNKITNRIEIAEKPEGETSFTSVFTGESADNVPPRLPRGPALPAEPKFKKGEELAATPEKGDRPIPKYSRRAVLAEQAAEKSYDQLPRAAVNRLWAHVFGRGLVHPVDFIHPDNPPSHPAVLDLLTQDFREHGCDVKRTLRELMLTEAYGRTCELPSGKQLNAAVVSKRLKACETEAAALEKQLAAAEAATDAAREALGKLEVVAEKDAAKAPAEKLAAAAAEREACIDRVRRLKTLYNAELKSLEEARTADEYLQAAKSDAASAEQKWTLLVDFWSNRADVPLLRPLPPEPFTDSILQAAGIVATAQAKARTTIQKSPPKEMKEAKAAERSSIEAILVDKQTFEPLRTNFKDFVNLYADAPGQDFSATVNQALFFGNAPIVGTWLKPDGTNLTARLTAMKDVDELADELYLSVLTRLPTDDERADVADYLKDRTSDRSAAVQEMAWALMSSTEFRFNH